MTLRLRDLVPGLSAVVVVCCCGCSSGGGDDEAIRAAWGDLQKAIQAKDADKVWALLDPDSRKEADQAAAKLRENYARATGEDRKKLEDEWGVPADDPDKLTGKALIRSRKFHKKYHEIPESKVEKITPTLQYVEPDNDKEKLSLVRQEGAWKFHLTLPVVQGP
jgi:hypothetical protein